MVVGDLSAITKHFISFSSTSFILLIGNGQFIIQAAVPQQQPQTAQIVQATPQQATIVQNRGVPTVVQTSQVQVITTYKQLV